MVSVTRQHNSKQLILTNKIFFPKILAIDELKWMIRVQHKPMTSSVIYFLCQSSMKVKMLR